MPHFLGVFPKDNLPTNILRRCSAIVNLDNMGNKGTHWVAIYNDLESNYVEYFDSYGVQPPVEILYYLETSGKPILFNTSQVQPAGTNHCGYLCIQYIKNRQKGIQPYEIIHGRKILK